MNLHTCLRVAAGVVMMLSTLHAVRAADVFAQGKAGKGAQARVSARQRSAPPAGDDGPASRHVEEGLRHADAGDWAAALKSYAQAIAVNPRDADAHLYTGDAYMSLGKSEEAFAAYRQAIRVAPRNAEAHYSLGAAYNDLARYGDAFKPFVQAIQLDSEHAEAHHGIGYAYLRLENFKEAVGYLKRAIRLRPDYAEAHLSLGLTYLGLGQLKAAEEELKVLEGMDRILAKVLDKELRGSAAAAARPPEESKPYEGSGQVATAPAPAVRPQVKKPEPAAETPPQQQASQTPRSKPQRAEAAPAVTPQRPAQRPPAEAQAKNSASQLAVEVSFWDSIKNSTDPEEFAAYLKKYPQGEFAALARIRMRAVTPKGADASKAADVPRQEEAAAAKQPQAAAEAQPTQTVAAPVVETRPEPQPAPQAMSQPASQPAPQPTPNPLEETLKSLRQEFAHKFSYKATAPGEDPNVAAVTSDVVIDYEPLQFDGCRIEWRDMKDILSVSLSDLDPLGVKVEARSKPNTTFSTAIWNLGVATAGGRQAIKEFKGDGSGAINNYNGLDLQFNDREKAERLARLLRRAVELCAGAQANQ